jgi:hypothetical protein
MPDGAPMVMLVIGVKTSVPAWPPVELRVVLPPKNTDPTVLYVMGVALALAAIKKNATPAIEAV